MSMVFPKNRVADGGCDEWCVALHAVEKAATGLHFARYFDPDDFMMMSRVDDRHGSITLYKHIDTRRYLNADDQGGTYWYAPGSIVRERRGDYVPHESLQDAFEELCLWELLWMRPEYEERALGLDYADRWKHPDVPEHERVRLRIEARKARRNMRRGGT